MKLSEQRALDTAIRRVEEARDRVLKLAEETGSGDLKHIAGGLSVELGSLRGILKRGAF